MRTSIGAARLGMNRLRRVLVGVAVMVAGVGVGAAGADASTWSPYFNRYATPVAGCSFNFGIVYDTAALAQPGNPWGIFVGVATTGCNASKYRIDEWVRLKWVPTDAAGHRDTRYSIRYSVWSTRTTFNTRGDSATNILVTAPRACGRGIWSTEGGVTVRPSSASTSSTTYLIPAGLIAPTVDNKVVSTPCKGPNN